MQTALAGPPLDRESLQRDVERSVAAVADWVVELSRADRDTAARADESYERLLEKPLRRFGAVLPEDSDLVERTLELVRPLREGHVPPVFEHGDLSHPNLIRLADGRVGVVDWELAEPRGLPAHDLCFFLAYAAFARGRAGTTDQQLRAFDEAFFGPDAWATTPARGLCRSHGRRAPRPRRSGPASPPLARARALVRRPIRAGMARRDLSAIEEQCRRRLQNASSGASTETDPLPRAAGEASCGRPRP